MTNLCACRDYINAGFGFVALAAIIENFPFHGRVASAFTLAAAHVIDGKEKRFGSQYIDYGI